jgi:YHS domain-containing protein
MRKTTVALLATFLLLAATAAFAEGEVQPSGKLTRVESKTVCMINEHAMGKDQIPVEVEGRTYYGCCDMCKKALTTDATKRVAIDPVTHKQVDKATAVIASQQDGRVFYFENEANLAKYNQQYAK